MPAQGSVLCRSGNITHACASQYFFILFNEGHFLVKSFAPYSERTLAKHKPVWIFSNKRRRLLMRSVKGCVKLLNYVPLPLSEVWPLTRPAATAKQSCRNSLMKWVSWSQNSFCSVCPNDTHFSIRLQFCTKYDDYAGGNDGGQLGRCQEFLFNTVSDDSFTEICRQVDQCQVCFRVLSFFAPTTRLGSNFVRQEFMFVVTQRVDPWVLNLRSKVRLASRKALLFSAELKPHGYYLELFWQADLG